MRSNLLILRLFMSDQIKITLPDGAVRQLPKGSTALDLAKSISEGLARKVLAAEINGEVWDATRPIENDVTLKLLTWDDNGGHTKNHRKTNGENACKKTFYHYYKETCSAKGKRCKKTGG